MDDVTALRDALLERLTSDWDMDPWGGYEASKRRLEADLDALIAAVEARAAITPERLARALSGDGVYDLLDRFVHGEGDVLREDIAAAILAALPARSAGSGSRVEVECICGEPTMAAAHDAAPQPWPTHRPTPPPAVDGTRVERVRRELDRLLVDAHAVPDHEREVWARRLARAAASRTPPAPDTDRCPVDGCDDLPEDHHHPDNQLQTLKTTLDHAEKNLGVIALTLTDHPEYPVKAADVDAARSLARFTAQDIRAARALLADGERSE